MASDYRQTRPKHEPRRIRREGPLKLLAKTDSFSAPDILIDGNSMAELVWDCFRHHAGQGRILVPGRWRFVLEYLGEKAPPGRGYQPRTVNANRARPPREE